MTGKQKRIDALLNLLEDEDNQVSTLAMEQLLSLEHEADALVKEFQEAPSPRLRTRIHQLSNILNLRRNRNQFIETARTSEISVWDGLQHINYQFNPRMNSDAIDRITKDLIEQAPRKLSTAKLCAYMRDEHFSYPGEDTLGADLFLIEDVLAQRVGAPILLSIIARHIGTALGWDASIVLYRGKHCLVDIDGNLIESADGWKISRLSRDEKMHPCGDRDIWLTVLAQLFLAAMLEGRLQAIHRVAVILAELSNGSASELPYPLGS